MKKFLGSAGVFVKTLRRCLSDAWSDCDCHYHIPKSRFKDPVPGSQEQVNRAEGPRKVRRNAFLGSFRDCVLSAWDAADREYHIPKSRFLDPEHNRTAYRSSSGPGFAARVGAFLATLGSCISVAWKESDHYYHLPKSSYQNAEFVKEKIRSAPRPQGKLLYRPYVTGIGEVVGEGAGSGWTVNAWDDARGEAFLPPEETAGMGGKRELEI
jgi:hypothetical protein